MKTKKFLKKLDLNKETISNLDASVMDKVKGGCNETDCRSCATNPITCSVVMCPISTKIPPFC